MGDVGDSFEGWAEASQEKRRGNRENSTAMLAGAGFKFQEKNKGAHLIVDVDGRVVDFWPGTGLWIDRKNGKRKRGVRPLLAHLRKLSLDHPQREVGANESHFRDICKAMRRNNS